jgi:hypothetical protein
MKNNSQVVVIDWWDAVIHGSNPTTLEEAKKYSLIHSFSAGILIHEDKEQITIAMDWFDNPNHYREIHTYPKSGIKKIIRFDCFKKFGKWKE